MGDMGTAGKIGAAVEGYILTHPAGAGLF